MVCTVKFGLSGVIHNYGLPHLSRLERNILEKNLLILARREAIAARYLRNVEKCREEEEKRRRKKQKDEEERMRVEKDLKNLKIDLKIDDDCNKPIACRVE